MFSLYTNKYIKKDPGFRWWSFFIDFTLTNQHASSLATHLSNWSTPFIFSQKARKNVPKTPGIYIFYVQPSIQLHPAQSFVLYIGYSMNLWNRYYDYIVYKRSEEPNYIDRRIMLNVWEKNLYYSYISLPGFTEDQVLEIEQKLYNSLVPPINRSFTQATVKEQVRLNR